MAEREVMGIEGELEHNWAAMMMLLQRRRSGGRPQLQKKDLEATGWQLEVARARIEGAADADRPLAPEPEIAAIEVAAPVKLQIHKNLENLLRAFAEANTLRRWVRDIHQAWAPDRSSPFGILDPFETGDADRRKALSQHLPAFNRLRYASLFGLGIFLLLSVMLVIRAKMAGS